MNAYVPSGPSWVSLAAGCCTMAVGASLVLYGLGVHSTAVLIGVGTFFGGLAGVLGAWR